MKNHFTYFLLAALVCAMGIVSCQHDGLTPEEQKAQQEQEQAEKTSRFWSVVGQLVAASDITDDYKGKTFEPVIGVPDASDPQTRIVATNSAAAAAKSFANLVNEESVTEQTTTYTWRDEEVGTLTYSKGTSGAWAEVKVDIPAVPHLSKLIYRSPEQGDDNASFEGSAYYRFGDVISLTKNGKTEYWVCVRPAFNPEGKGDSHWMSIGDLPEENIWHYTGSNGMDYYFPTKLKYNKEHMQNLAELLYALCYPDTWSQNITNYSTIGTFGSPGGLPMFHDFHMTNLKYHNANFWNNVASAWREKGVDVQLFGKTLDGIAQEIESTGLHFLYNGYSWWTATSNYATVYQAKFVNTPGSVHANMQTEKPYTEQKVQMIYKNQPNKDVPFDVRDKKGVINAAFFGDSAPRYIVRYAKGSELSSTGKYSDVHVAIPGATDVYRYYRDVVPVEDLAEHEPEITQERIVNEVQKQNFSDFTGTGHYLTGSIYEDEAGDRWIVFNIAGQGKDHDYILDINCEASPIAELISFDGLRASAGHVSNVPDFVQAVRAASMIRQYYGSGLAAYAGNNPENTSFSDRMIKHLHDNMGLDLLSLVQRSKGWGDERNFTQVFSVAYYDANLLLSQGAQPLFRFLYPISLNNDKPPIYLWKHYPAQPDMTTKEQKNFSETPILLQDIAKADMVNRYAPDFYATQPLASAPDVPRNIRTSPDMTAANDLSAYFYNSNSWGTHLDMWNAPVLMFRTDAVYDRGTEYATVTLGGHHLRLVARMEEFESQYEDELRASYTLVYTSKMSVYVDTHDGTTWLDGKDYVVPDWKAAWNR